MNVDFFHNKFSSIYAKPASWSAASKMQKLEVAELEEIQEDLTVLYRLGRCKLCKTHGERAHSISRASERFLKRTGKKPLKQIITKRIRRHFFL